MAQIDFTGNLGADAELRHTQQGRPVLNFRVADTKSKPDGNGGWEKLKEQWLNVSLWGEAAEFYGPLLVKGTRVRVFGEFYAREYEGQNGRGISLDVEAHGVHIYPPKRNQQAGGFGGQSQQSSSWSPKGGGNDWGSSSDSAASWGNGADDTAPAF
ncbi:single-stranded DNA-binding protein [Arthrobacter sp. USHLN218]|uniref:single-stranded DNA-binding protein n=1 Tax=Arthrobacter sp. USHLN218 TaxID=3081232 RepID=UPI00301A55EE